MRCWQWLECCCNKKFRALWYALSKCGIFQPHDFFVYDCGVIRIHFLTTSRVFHTKIEYNSVLVVFAVLVLGIIAQKVVVSVQFCISVIGHICVFSDPFWPKVPSPLINGLTDYRIEIQHVLSRGFSTLLKQRYAKCREHRRALVAPNIYYIYIWACAITFKRALKLNQKCVQVHEASELVFLSASEQSFKSLGYF